MSGWFQTDYPGFIYNLYRIMLCLIFSGLGSAATTLESSDGNGIALVNSDWNAVIEFRRQVNAGVAIPVQVLETGSWFAAYFVGLGVTTILLRQFATWLIENSGRGLTMAQFTTLSNTIGALLVFMIGTVSFWLFSTRVEP